MIYKYLFLSLLIVYSIACSNKKISGRSALAGNWQWIKRTGGIAGRTATPQSTGKTWSITFNKDSAYSESGTLMNNSSGTYQLSESNNIKKIKLNYSEGTTQYNYELSHDSLWLIQAYPDGFSYLLIKTYQ